MSPRVRLRLLSSRGGCVVFERRRVFRFPILFIAKYVTGFPSRLGGPSKTSACSLLGVISIPTKASASARPVAADDKMNFSPPPSPDMRGKDPSAGLRYRHSWLLINGETPPTILQRKIQAAGTMKDGKTLRVRARAYAPPRTSTHASECASPVFAVELLYQPPSGLPAHEPLRSAG